MRWATALRSVAGVATSFPRDPSARRCRASHRLASASAWSSHPQPPSAARPRIRPSRRNGPSTCRWSASLNPCLRQGSETGIPASCSFKIPMICSSVKRLRLMFWSSQWARTNFKLHYPRGATPGDLAQISALCAPNAKTPPLSRRGSHFIGCGGAQLPTPTLVAGSSLSRRIFAGIWTPPRIYRACDRASR